MLWLACTRTHPSRIALAAPWRTRLHVTMRLFSPTTSTPRPPAIPINRPTPIRLPIFNPHQHHNINTIPPQRRHNSSKDTNPQSQPTNFAKTAPMSPSAADTDHLLSPEAKMLLASRTLLDQDREQLQTPDSKFTRLSWRKLKEIVNENRLELLRRVPSDLAKYILWLDGVRRDYPKGGVMEFILKDKLGWYEEGEVGGRPKWDGRGVFESKDDVSILLNDWPYGLATDPPIIHLVVWLKTPVPINPADGDLTPESRSLLDGFVQDVFGSVVGSENVLWFKNWASLQSVPSVEHFHVLVQGPTEEQVRAWVEGPWGGKRVRKTVL